MTCPLNIELLERVKQHILEEPKRLDMELWRDTADKSDPDAPACRTYACIGGWTELLGNSPRGKKGADQLLNLRGLGGDELNEDLYDLFFDYIEWWTRKDSPKMRARQAARRIDALIKKWRER